MDVLQPYQTTDRITKQNIVSQAQPTDAISLCQVDSRSRQACDSLPISEKVRICLINDQNASKCDSIPMFSRFQFLSLIPPQILVHDDDPLQPIHEFYSQNYKLPTEGFSVAMYKARLMNTICAAMRPEILIKYADRFPPMPPYMNVDVIESIVANYAMVSKDPLAMYQNLPNDGTLRLQSRFGLRLALYGKMFKPRPIPIGNNPYGGDPLMQIFQEPVDEPERYSNRSYIDIIYGISAETGELFQDDFMLTLLDDPDPEDIERETAELNAKQAELDRKFGINGQISQRDRYMRISRLGFENPNMDIPPEVYQPSVINVRKDRRVKALMKAFANDRFLIPYSGYIRTTIHYDTTAGFNFYKHWARQDEPKFPNALVISRILKMLFDEGIVMNASITVGPVFQSNTRQDLVFGTVGPRIPMAYPL